MKLRYIVISIVALIFLAIGGLFYYATQKINEKELKQLTVAFLEEEFPHADVTVGSVSLGFGSSLTLTVKEIGLRLSSSQKNWNKSPLFKVRDAKVKIPLWALLKDNQSIQIGFEKPEIHYVEVGNQNNWQIAMGAKSEVQTPSGRSGSGYVIPAFLVNSKINLKLSNTQLVYRLKDSGEGKVIVKNFKINNIGRSGNAAYEVNSDISLGFNNNSIEIGLILIGQFKTADLLDKGIFSITSVLTINKINIPSAGIRVPRFKTDIKLTFVPNGEVNADIIATLNEQSRMRTLLKITKGRLKLDEIDLSLALKDIFSIFDVKISHLNVGSGKFFLVGNLAVHPNGGLTPWITFKLSPDIQYVYEGITFKGGFKGSYKKKALVLNTVIKALGGRIYSDLTAEVNLDKPSIVISNLPPFKLSLSANDLVLSKENLRRFLYKTNHQKSNKDSPREKDIKKTRMPMPLLPRGKVDVRLKNILIAKEPFSLETRLELKNQEIVAKPIYFKFSEGRGDGFSQSRFYKEGSKNSFSLNLKDIKLSGFNAFLPESIEKINGVSSGKIQGHFNSLNKQTYNIDLDLKVTKGELLGVNLKEYVQKIVDALGKIPGLGKKSKVNRSRQAIVFNIFL